MKHEGGLEKVWNWGIQIGKSVMFLRLIGLEKGEWQKTA